MINIIDNSYWAGSGEFNNFGLNMLAKRFQWPKNDTESFDRTIKLKLELQKRWDRASANERLEIAEYIIKTWGGIKGNKATTIEQYAHIDIETNNFPFTGVASYSKVLGIIDPHRFAILDARVIVSLNAIQLLSNAKYGVFFSYLQGRNKVTGDNTNKRGFSQTSIFKRESPLFKNWDKPKRNEIYKLYLEMLTTEARRLNEPLYKLEMSLFADAEKLAKACADKFGVSL